MVVFSFQETQRVIGHVKCGVMEMTPLDNPTLVVVTLRAAPLGANSTWVIAICGVKMGSLQLMHSVNLNQFLQLVGGFEPKFETIICLDDSVFDICVKNNVNVAVSIKRTAKFTDHISNAEDPNMCLDVRSKMWGVALSIADPSDYWGLRELLSFWVRKSSRLARRYPILMESNFKTLSRCRFITMIKLFCPECVGYEGYGFLPFLWHYRQCHGDQPEFMMSKQLTPLPIE